MSRFKQVLSDGKLNDVFRDDLSENFNKADAELTRLENESKTRDETIGKAIASKESESIGRDDDLQEDVDSKNSQAHARMTQIEQESITRDNEHKNSTSAHPAENITYSGPINALTAKAAIEWVYTQLNNIIANAGKDNTEIVDGRLGADGIARATIGLLLREIHQEQLAANKKTEIVGHGTHILNQSGKTSSPVKVEFYGQTLVNLIPNFSSGKWTFHANTTVISSKEIKINATTAQQSSSVQVKVKPNTYYLLGGVLLDTDGRFYLSTNPTSGGQFGLISKTAPYIKFNSGANESIYIVTGNTSIGTFTYKEPKLFEISADTYNKIGVSLLDADVERMFPYVSGVQSVKNPVVITESENIIDIYAELSKIAPTLVNRLAENEIEIIPNLTPFNNKVMGTFAKNTQYTFAFDIRHEGSTRGIYFIIEYSDGTTSTLSINTVNASYESVVFNSVAGKTISNLRLTYGSSTSKTYLRNFRINIGAVSKQFSPYNPSYLYAECILAGNDNKKDILSYNEDKRRWEKTKWWMTDVVLDGSLGWALNSDKTGYKNVQIPTTSSAVLNTGNLIKYDGKVLLPRNFVDFNGGDFYLIQSGSPYIIVSLSDTDTGFTDAMTPSVDLIKSYFYCWFYRGDGTTHKWRPIGDTDDSRLTTVLPTSMAPTVAEGKVQPYKLTYQLATPVIEEVKVDGDLVVSGATQVMVGSEFTYTEDAVTKKRTYTITPTSQRTGANLLEVKATYDSNFKSSYDSTVGKVNNIAESLSVLDMQMYRVLLALKNNNITV
ncbi:hypothetical protein [Schinkia azotoformans]|uniref:hypothetical protein n=1 Tax=Schinkia azotoformans TaxID=1454 RepID=UPI002DB674E9|nr:hypothetical protein [Schinkia azotoformans]MEC1757478.1 hypothetical protein [Schinkia azotoformans]